MNVLQSNHPKLRARVTEPLIGIKNMMDERSYHKMGWVKFKSFLGRLHARRCASNQDTMFRDAIACGYKIMYNQIPTSVSDEKIIEWCRDNDILVVHLVRYNILRNRISKALLWRDQDHNLESHFRTNDEDKGWLKKKIQMNTTKEKSSIRFDMRDHIYWKRYVIAFWYQISRAACRFYTRMGLNQRLFPTACFEKFCQGSTSRLCTRICSTHTGMW